MKSGTAAIERSYKPFPPGLGHVKVPMSSRQASSVSLGLYSACKAPTSWLQRIAIGCVRVFGPRVLPGRTVRWVPPMNVAVWTRLVDVWQNRFGAFDDIAIHERSQSSRSGIAILLIRSGSPLAFVKLRHGNPELSRHEFSTMQDVWAYQPKSFAIPEPMDFGIIEDWAYLVTSSLPSPGHRVSRNPPLANIEVEIAAALGSRGRPSTVPDHWSPMHGDFTPWNLREVPHRTLMLYDWEDAGWGPPHADDVLYRASYAALRNLNPGVHPAQEAIHYWHGRVMARRWSGDRERRLARTLSVALDRMLSKEGRRVTLRPGELA